MSDEELKRLSQIDGKDLSTEASTALNREFQKRKLDTTIFFTLRAHKLAEQQKHAETTQEAKRQEFEASIWTYCFEAKREGRSCYFFRFLISTLFTCGGLLVIFFSSL